MWQLLLIPLLSLLHAPEGGRNLNQASPAPTTYAFRGTDGFGQQGNHAPVVRDETIEAQTVAVGDHFDLYIDPFHYFFDADEDALQLNVSVVERPGWATFNQASDTLYLNPKEADVGNYTVRVQAIDPAGAAASFDFGLTVVPEKDALAGFAYVLYIASGTVFCCLIGTFSWITYRHRGCGWMRTQEVQRVPVVEESLVDDDLEVDTPYATEQIELVVQDGDGTLSKMGDDDLR